MRFQQGEYGLRGQQDNRTSTSVRNRSLYPNMRMPTVLPSLGLSAPLQITEIEHGRLSQDETLRSAQIFLVTSFDGSYISCQSRM